MTVSGLPIWTWATLRMRRTSEDPIVGISALELSVRLKATERDQEALRTIPDRGDFPTEEPTFVHGTDGTVIAVADLSLRQGLTVGGLKAKIDHFASSVQTFARAYGAAALPASRGPDWSVYPLPDALQLKRIDGTIARRIVSSFGWEPAHGFVVSLPCWWAPGQIGEREFAIYDNVGSNLKEGESFHVVAAGRKVEIDVRTGVPLGELRRRLRTFVENPGS